MSLSTLVPRACCLMHQSGRRPTAPTPNTCGHSALSAAANTNQQDQCINDTLGCMTIRSIEPAGSRVRPSRHLWWTDPALLALLSTHGVLTDSIASLTDFPVAAKPSLPDQLIPH
jgi:hypothetical protein